MAIEKVSNTSKRLQEIMSERGLRQVDIINKCRPYADQYHILIKKAHISLYVKGTVEPNQGKLFILAKALNVSEAWLMGYDVARERQPSQDETKIDMTYTSDGAEHQIDLKGLDDAQKRLVAEYVALLKRSKR